MAFEFITGQTTPTEWVELGETVWLDENGNAVKDGDPTAASLLARAGKRIPKARAEELGLLDEPEQDKEIEQDEEFEDDGYEELTVDDLRELLDERDLPVSGTKAQLIERLRTDDLAEASA